MKPPPRGRPRHGQPGAVGTPLDQARAEIVLEAPQLAGQGRLGDVALVRGAAEMAGLGDHQQVVQYAFARHHNPLYPVR
jgi:hypothetical protein